VIGLYLNKWTRRLSDLIISIGCHPTTEEGGPQVDGDAGKPYRMIQKSEVQITSS